MASCAITAVGGVKLIRGELEQLTAILLAVGFVNLLSICLYVWFKRSRIGESRDTLVKHYSQKTRRLALVGLFAVALLMVLSGGGWYHWHNLLKNPVVVLIADFKSLQFKDRGVEEEIIRQLGDALAEYDDVKLQALNEEITAQEGSQVARAKGEKHHADIVLWGWYQETDSHVQVTVKFEILEKLRFSSVQTKLLSSVQTKQLIQPITKLESFEIQTQLSEEMSYLTLFTIGLVRFDAQDYDNAITRFTKALKFVPDAEQATAKDMALEALYLSRGFTYQLQGIQHTTYYNKALDEHLFRFTNRYTYSDKGKLDQAIADYNRALKINPKFAEAYHNRGGAYHNKGELEQAIADYTQAFKIRQYEKINFTLFP
ncbi:MAG: tetratricopeptide repeat protein [Symploca sp. SIO2D2]|nr:tetratricopeptide repeat protein [Symploca sp. SIO2D2]